jgi:predicted transcriptional regulator
MPATLPRPTDAELEILSVLWDRGPSTVRDVQGALGPDRKTGYTTALKLLLIMLQKGLVIRDETQRTHVYRPAVPEHVTQQQLVTSLLDRAFRGSAAQLVLHALETSRTSPEEIEEIGRLLDRRRGVRR